MPIPFPSRCAARLLRPPDSQQIPPLGRPELSDGATRSALQFLGVDVLHALGPRTQDARPGPPRYDSVAVPRAHLRTPRDARRDHARITRRGIVAGPDPGLGGTASRHAAQPRVRAGASHVVGQGRGARATAVQGRHRMGREHALGDGRRSVGCGKAV